MTLPEVTYRAVVWDVLILGVVALGASVELRTLRVPRWVSLPLLLCGGWRTLAAGNWPGGLALLWVTLDPAFIRDRPDLENALRTALLVVASLVAALQQRPELILTVASWVTIYGFYRLNWIAGGERLLFVALLALSPHLSTLLCLTGGWVLAALFWLLHRYGALAFLGFLTLPTQAITRQELETKGAPVAFGFAVGWGGYLLLNVVT